MEEIINALELKKQLDALRPIDREQEAKIMQKFRLDWNYHSNNLEGNSLTYGETKALIMHGITAQGKPLKDHFEVTGHNEAINWVVEVVKGDRPLTESFIRELHVLLLKERHQVNTQTSDGKPTKKWIEIGSYKSTSNHVETVTGEIFYFATPEETPAKMSDLMAWYNEKIEDETFNRILLAAEFHYKFISIHPFDDGNGRTARILMNFILMKFGYPPVIIKTEDKANYFAALQLADVGQLEAFVNYIARNLVRSLEIMIAGANGESIEEPDDIDKEIALLEKRLNGLGEKSNSGKSQEALMDVLVNNVFYLRNQFNSNRFEKFYIEISLTYCLIKYTIYYDEDIGVEFEDKKSHFFSTLESCLENLSLDSISFSMLIKFTRFNRIGFGDFDFDYDITFQFNKISYNILSNNEKIVEKPYGIYLSIDELKNIVWLEEKRHTAFIEQKIAEKEKDQ